MHHGSVILDSSKTTCKYLHRKDLPFFSVDEGIREHASEFTEFYSMVDLYKKTPIKTQHYSEKYYWDKLQFDANLHSMAHYHAYGSGDGDESQSSGKKWRYISAFAGNADAIKAVLYPSLVRRYTQNCGSWTSSYRLMLSLFQEVDIKPYISDKMLYNGHKKNETQELALYEVIFSRFSAIQEYGWHSSLDKFRNAPSNFVDYLINGEFEEFWPTLSETKSEWEKTLIDFAKREGVYFPDSAYAAKN